MDDELKKDARFSDEKSNHIQAVMKISSDGVQGYYLSSLIWTLNAKLYTFVMQGHSLIQENK